MKRNKSPDYYSPRFIRNVIIKSLFLFIVCNLLFVASTPTDPISRISAYNFLFPGRERLPFGERPDLAYNFTTNNLPAMIASHEINGVEKEPGEYRVIVIGDSSVWGYLLTPNDTLSSQINQANIYLQDGRHLRAYNLGYPTLSVLKDVYILSKSMQFQPDLILWLVTLESLLWEKQLASPILQNNIRDVQKVIQDWQLPMTIRPSMLIQTSPWEKTIFGQRRNLADWFRLQLYGVLWAATGIDQAYLDAEPPQWDLAADDSFYDLTPENLSSTGLAFSLIQAAVDRIGREKVIVINEPIFISGGKNSEIRYNFYYPRWAYDQYRIMFEAYRTQYDWQYIDAWNIIPPEEFSNSAIHLSKQGTHQVASEIIRGILTHSGKP